MKAFFRANILTDIIVTMLNPKLKYTVFIHSPNFFLYTYNPMTMPIIMYEYFNEEVAGKKKIEMQYLKVYREEKIGREGHPCNNDGYSFNKCIRGTISKEIGCRLPWDLDTTGSFSLKMAVLSKLNKPIFV